VTAEEIISTQVAVIKQKAEGMIKNKDANGDGSISFDEFKAEPKKGGKGEKQPDKVKGDKKPDEKPKGDKKPDEKPKG